MGTDAESISSGVSQQTPTLLNDPLNDNLNASLNSNELGIEKPPDGGLRAWLQVLGAHLVNFSTWGFVNAFGVFQSYYVEAFNATPSAVSWIGSVQLFIIFFLGTFTGRALDAGYFRQILFLGSILIVAGILAASFSTVYWHLLLAQGFCAGIGSGMVFCPCVALCSTYFHKKKSLALAAAASGSATGGIIIPVVVKALLSKIGFAWTMRTVGLIVLVLLTVSNLILKPRLKPRKSGSVVEWAAFKEPTYTFFAIGMFMGLWGLYFAFFYVSAYARTNIGLSQETAFNMVIIINSVGIPGRLIPGFLADRAVGPLNLLIPTFLIVGVILFAWMRVNTYTGLIIWAVFYGFYSAGVQSLFPATLGSLTSDLSKAGTRMGMIFTIISFACLTGPPIGGLLLQLEGSYWAAQLFSGLCLMCGALFLGAGRIAKTGLVWRAKA